MKNKLLIIILVLMIPALSVGLFKLDARHEGFTIDIKTGNDEMIELLEQRGKDLKDIRHTLERYEEKKQQKDIEDKDISYLL